MSRILVIGGSGGLGRAVAGALADRGDAVIVTSRDPGRAEAAAREIGGRATGLGVDLAMPETIAGALTGVDEIDGLVITAIHQDGGSIHAFSVADAVRAATVKLVGYAEAVRALRDRFAPHGSVVLFGGSAKDRPYPGSTMVSATNGGVSSLVRTLAWELAPIRVNALHPGVVLDSPVWRKVPGNPPARTLTGTPITMADIVDATQFLLRNPAVNALDLHVDGGVRLMDGPVPLQTPGA
ncbi:SDR family oxidoreductase [Amycolatopsis sp. DSM 110486]|uniref:SDR family oxidoreductase n=1 Tax=Amycolatopsis sp. DSM 110486 TaxID=2865832 RepID=UPI001C69845E|nr:SDR family oxidoreductase [Amycolatopsis sp. DSM 110486]QYN20885.1 SDR family oxidoreductase [Amycolatopsis sp. DSM 110486]